MSASALPSVPASIVARSRERWDAGGELRVVPISEMLPKEGASRFLLGYPFALPVGDLAMLYGDGGVGKSWLAYQLSIALANGKPFLGQQPTPCRVLLLDFENPREEVALRLTNSARRLGVGREALDASVTALPLAGTGLGLAEHLDAVLDVIAREKPGLIVVDGWQAAFGLVPEAAAETTFAVRVLHQMAKQGATILVLHHVSTGGLRSPDIKGLPAPAGNRQVQAAFRSIYYMSELKGVGVKLDTRKQNYGVSAAPVTLTKQVEGGAITFAIPEFTYIEPNAPKDWAEEVVKFLRANGNRAMNMDLKRYVASMLGRKEKTAERKLEEPLARLEQERVIRRDDVSNTWAWVLCEQADNQPDTAGQGVSDAA